MNESPVDTAVADATSATDPAVTSAQLTEASAAITGQEPPLIEIKNLPRELAAMLVVAGIVGIVLPGPGTPALIAGGIALWPNAFGKLESWFARRNPRLHRKGMEQLQRYLSDLEKRYPNSTRPVS